MEMRLNNVCLGIISKKRSREAPETADGMRTLKALTPTPDFLYRKVDANRTDSHGKRTSEAQNMLFSKENGEKMFSAITFKFLFSSVTRPADR